MNEPIDLNPREWQSSDRKPERAPRAKYTLKIFLMALAVSALWNSRSIERAFSSLYAPAPDHSIVAPGNYAWTPEHGLQPLTAGSPATQPRQ